MNAANSETAPMICTLPTKSSRNAPQRMSTRYLGSLSGTMLHHDSNAHQEPRVSASETYRSNMQSTSVK